MLEVEMHPDYPTEEGYVQLAEPVRQNRVEIQERLIYPQYLYHS